MIDAPPAIPIELSEPAETPAESRLATQERENAKLVIDLLTLAPPKKPRPCIASDPNPLENGILVCGESEEDQRIGSQYGPADEPDFASAIPRARLKLSDNAETEANVIKKGVGGWDADGGEIKVKIDF